MDATSSGEVRRIKDTMRSKVQGLISACRADFETQLQVEMRQMVSKTYV